MTGPLDLDRFRVLADAYGGVVARWPAPDRDAAAAIAVTREGAAILASASLLDARLDGWRLPAPSRALAERIGGRARPPVGRSVPKLRWWWSGLGLLAAAGGAAAGTAAVAVAAPIEAAPIGAGPDSTAFGEIGGGDR